MSIGTSATLPAVIAAMAWSLTLAIVKAMINGPGDLLIDLARSNLPR
jgi:hypothetical protein